MKILKRDQTHLTCATCKIEKPVKDFYPGELGSCMECKKARAKATRAAKKASKTP